MTILCAITLACLALGACLLNGCTAAQVKRTQTAVTQADAKLDGLLADKAQLELMADTAFEIYKTTQHPDEHAEAQADYLAAKSKIAEIDAKIPAVQSSLKQYQAELQALTDPNLSDMDRGIGAGVAGVRAYRDAGLPYGEIAYTAALGVAGGWSVVASLFGLRRDRQLGEVVTGINNGVTPEDPNVVNLANPAVRASMSPDTQLLVRKKKEALKPTS